MTERKAISASETKDRTEPVQLPQKLYFKIREVSAIADVAPYVLRYWETEFHQIRPKRTAAGQRLFRRQDVLKILEIKRLLYEKKFTIEGARRFLRKKRRPASGTDLPRQVLEEVRAELKKLRDLLS